MEIKKKAFNFLFYVLDMQGHKKKKKDVELWDQRLFIHINVLWLMVFYDSALIDGMFSSTGRVY